MYRCFKCIAIDQVNSHMCISEVQVVKDDQRSGVWLVKLGCPGGVISLITEVLGDSDTAEAHGKRLVNQFRLRETDEMLVRQ